MSFDWAEYLSIAEALSGLSVSGPAAGIEARQRAAVSRAYYAAFASARNRLRDQEGIASPVNRNPHLFVANEYEKDPDLGRRQIGITLRQLRLDRNRCDYDDVLENLPLLTQRSLTGAARVLAGLARL